jgi:hydroxyethylthiazole kinase-like uncharacterized protein yjeF
MKVFTSDQIRKIDAYTIEHEPVASIDLMERAALALASWFRERFNQETEFLLLAGPGNNGGDAWALARILFHHGYENIRFYLLGKVDDISHDSKINRTRLIDETDIQINAMEEEADFPFITGGEWVVDALFGSGLSRPLSGLAKELVQYINDSAKTGLIAVDIPSGLFGEDNTDNDTNAIIKANFTLSFQFPKLAFFMSDNFEYVGYWETLSISLHEEAIKETETTFYTLEQGKVESLVIVRPKFAHKGTFGHVLVVAGSYGMMGAAVLATRAAVASGAGLVTAHVPRFGYEIMQSSVPESLICLDESDLIFTEVNHLERYTAIAVGPGINTKTNTVRAMKDLIDKAEVPMVIDADGVNILAQNKEWMNTLSENTIITPHPGEFDRLTHKHSSHHERILTQIELSKKNKIVVVLKGAHTSISLADGTVWFNTTGNPGMAKGGSGDVLTGIISSLLAQGYSCEDAAMLGVFIHGRAGDIALERKGYHALTPSDMINNLGRAFKNLE